jgi:hypothetical protein
MDFEGYLYKIGRFEYVVTESEKALQVRIYLKYRAS